MVGEGPTLHVHPYDEIFMITEGRARFTVGDRTIDAEAGEVVLGPANIPHGYKNLGPGRLDSLEQFPIRRNGRGFSNRHRSDSSCVLAKEAGMHGPSAFP